MLLFFILFIFDFIAISRYIVRERHISILIPLMTKLFISVSNLTYFYAICVHFSKQKYTYKPEIYHWWNTTNVWNTVKIYFRYSHKMSYHERWKILWNSLWNNWLFFRYIRIKIANLRRSMFFIRAKNILQQILDPRVMRKKHFEETR